VRKRSGHGDHPERRQTFDFSVPILMTGGAFSFARQTRPAECRCAVVRKIVVTTRNWTRCFLHKNGAGREMGADQEYPGKPRRGVYGSADAEALNFQVRCGMDKELIRERWTRNLHHVHEVAGRVAVSKGRTPNF